MYVSREHRHSMKIFTVFGRKGSADLNSPEDTPKGVAFGHGVYNPAVTPDSTPSGSGSRQDMATTGSRDELLTPQERRMRFLVTRYDSLGNIQAEKSPDDIHDETATSRQFSLSSFVRRFSHQTSILSNATPVNELPSTEGERVARRGRIFAKRYRRRLVYKSGECNISYKNIRKRRTMYMMDLFTTMIDLKWRYIFFMFAVAFVAGWILFALIWWILCVVNQDHIHKDDDNHLKCVDNVYDFPTALLFSIETQHTIGYGLRCMTPHCPVAILTLMAQSCFGVMVQATMAGLVFAKLTRPNKRGQTIIFSKNAVICQRDGVRYLMFRVADTRKSRLVGTTIRALLIKKKETEEGEVLPFYQHRIEVLPETGDDYLLLVWPLTLIHKIDEDSPFYDMSAEQLLTEQFEFVVFLEGTVEPTGMSTQVRTSYLPCEILWGHQLAPLMTYQKENGHYFIDYTLFHDAKPCTMSELSARDHAEHSFNRSQDEELQSIREAEEEVFEEDKNPEEPVSEKEEPIGNGSIAGLVHTDIPKTVPNSLDTNSNVCHLEENEV